ncbi:head decoration protein [Rhodoplanes sp. SY1]|uniref:head decoration protein n=1 Tax=Rhodoplanes sp. SY1 TaxID=3166646 RepID=UPI0038B5F7E3
MSLPVTRVTAPKLLSSWLKYEVFPDFTRDTGTLLAGAGGVRTVKAGQLVGKVGAMLEAVAAAKAGGNTGSGTLTLDAVTPVLAGAKAGVYTLRCIAAAANGGTFRVADPDGFVLGDVAVGATFANDLKFVVADGGTDFVAGDGFDVTVALDTDAPAIGKLVAWDPAGADGRQLVHGIALADAEAADGVDTVGGLLHLRRGPAIVFAPELLWPVGVTADQKAAAIAALGALGILARAA